MRLLHTPLCQCLANVSQNFSLHKSHLQSLSSQLWHLPQPTLKSTRTTLGTSCVMHSMGPSALALLSLRSEDVPGTHRAATPASTTTIARPGAPNLPTPRLAARPPVHRLAREQHRIRGGVVSVPLRSQACVGRHGSAAAHGRAPEVVSAAGGAQDVPTPLRQVINGAVPLVHLPAGWAAGALQPDPLLAGMLVVSGGPVIVFGGVPQGHDARIAAQGQVSGLPLLLSAIACTWEALQEPAKLKTSMCSFCLQVGEVCCSVARQDLLHLLPSSEGGLPSCCSDMPSVKIVFQSNLVFQIGPVFIPFHWHTQSPKRLHTNQRKGMSSCCNRPDSDPPASPYWHLLGDRCSQNPSQTDSA